MLSDDERAPQRNHHQDAEQTAEQGYQHYARDLEIKPQDHDRRHRYANAERYRLSSRARRLHYIVFQDRSVAQAQLRKQPEQSDRDHGHRN